MPEQGSVGASGDLAPLSHLALALIGEGEPLEVTSDLFRRVLDMRTLLQVLADSATRRFVQRLQQRGRIDEGVLAFVDGWQ